MNTTARQKFFLNLGRESAEAPVEPTEALEPMDEVATTELEAHDEAVELAEDENIVEDAIDTTEAVDELVVAAEAAIATGKGFNRIEAAAFNLALKAAVGKYTQVENHIVPAQESYEVSTNADGKTSATQDATNKETTSEAKKGLKETVKAFIASIIAKLKGVWKNIVNFVKSLGDRTQKNIGRLKSLATKLDSLPDFKDKVVEINGLNLHMDGKVEIPALKAGIEHLKEIIEKVYANARSSGEHAFLQQGMEAAMASDASPWEKARASLNAHTVTFFKSMEPNATKTENMYAGKDLPGGRQLVMNVPEEKGTKQLSFIQMKRTKGQGELKSQITVPNKESLAGIIDDLLFLMVKGQQFTDKNATKRVEADISSVTEKLKYNAAKEAELEKNRERIMSMFNLTMSGSSLRFWIYDLCLVVTNNFYTVAAKALGAEGDAPTKEKGKKGSDKKEEKQEEKKDEA